MNPAMHFPLVLATFSACLLIATCYDYSDILRLNVSCSPKDTCSIPRDLDDPEHHNCDCGSLCVLHQTCCIDSPFLNISSHFPQRQDSCRPAGTSGETSYFMVDTCPESYSGPLSIRRHCEQNAKDWSDPFDRIPVTRTSSHQTYKSIFCALCNGEDLEEVTMWQVHLDCSSLGDDMVLCTEDKDMILRNMVYVREKSQWGIWSRESKSDWTFRYLKINLRVPAHIRNYVQECRPNLVSDCEPNWPEDSVRELCRAYMGAVYLENASYRNVHCALCNNESLAMVSCYEKETLSYKGPSMNFGILLDFGLHAGNQVGTVDNEQTNAQKACHEQQVFDPFSKKCRTIECPLPGSVLKDGKCVQT